MLDFKSSGCDLKGWLDFYAVVRRMSRFEIWNLVENRKSGNFCFFNPNVFNPIQFVKTPLAKLQLSSLTSSLKVFGLEVCVSSEEEADIQNLLVFYFFFSNFPFIRRRLSVKWRKVPHILYSQTVLSQEKKRTFEGFLFKAAAASANPATPTEESKYYSCCSLVTKRENSDRKLRWWPSALLELQLLIKKKNSNKKTRIKPKCGRVELIQDGANTMNNPSSSVKLSIKALRRSVIGIKHVLSAGRRFGGQSFSLRLAILQLVAAVISFIS